MLLAEGLSTGLRLEKSNPRSSRTDGLGIRTMFSGVSWGGGIAEVLLFVRVFTQPSPCLHI